MPSNSREYVQAHYGKKYWGTPSEIHKVSLRVRARRKMVKKWLVKPWDNLEVDHIQSTSKWNWDSNLRVISKLRNRIAWQKKAVRSRLANNKK